MFDEQSKNEVVPPTNLPVEPADMFDSVEPVTEPPVAAEKAPDALSTGLLKRKVSDPDPAPALPVEGLAAGMPMTSSMSQPILGKILLVVLVLALMGVLGAGGWWLYSKSKTPVAPRAVSTIPDVKPDIVAKVDTVVPAAQPAKNKTDAVLFGAPSTVDTDNDGLSDQEEAQLGTDPRKPDTDADKLSDGDEVKMWHTDPLKSDTDGDTYLDGNEIEAGYSPVGSGKLLNPILPVVRFVSFASTTTQDVWQYVSYPIKGLASSTSK